MVDRQSVAWGAREIGEVINREPRQAQYLLESGAIRCARKATAKKRSQWIASVSELRSEFGLDSAVSHTRESAA